MQEINLELRKNPDSKLNKNNYTDSKDLTFDKLKKKYKTFINNSYISTEIKGSYFDDPIEKVKK